MKPIRRRGRRGNSIIEVTLMMPWILFLFVGVLDFGFYAYSFISTENAARAAALQTSKSKGAAGPANNPSPVPPSVCAVVLNELQGTVSYGTTLNASCNDSNACFAGKTEPCLNVTSELLPAGGPNGDNTDAAQVEVQYKTITMIPIPGMLGKAFTIDRKWQMKIDPAADF
ncbi:MAG TPA: TadE family protein [Bryobacteraceae bacterium]|nr:TadE family protein [Bryobacteraceae bacterium]